MSRLYEIYALNTLTGEVIPGCNADSIKELSYFMPLYSDGSDYVLMHSAITNPNDWVVILKKRHPVTGEYKEIPDVRRVLYDDSV